MKAVVYHKYGGPDVLELREVEKPVVGDDEALVTVRAASVNPLDWHTLRGTPFLVHLTAGFLKPKNEILGADISGQVEAVGKNVKKIRPGDDVFGESGSGGFAEYVCVPERRLALKPPGSTFEEAAALPVAAFTALQGLRDKGQIQSGQKVLINGASGGVGTFAVQIAKSFGAEVTGVCSTRNADLVRSIGADQVIDYTQEDFTRNRQKYDLIIDAVANRSMSDIKRALNPGGICVVVGYSPILMFQIILLGPWMARAGRKKLVLMLAKSSQDDLTVLQELLEAGKVTPVIDRTYSLGDVPEAIGYVEEGHAQGKVIISM